MTQCALTRVRCASASSRRQNSCVGRGSGRWRARPISMTPTARRPRARSGGKAFVALQSTRVVPCTRAEASGQRHPRRGRGGGGGKSGQPTDEPDSEIKLVRVQASGALGILNTEYSSLPQRKEQAHRVDTACCCSVHAPRMCRGTLARQAPETTAETRGALTNTLTPMVDFSLMSPLF